MKTQPYSLIILLIIAIASFSCSEISNESKTKVKEFYVVSWNLENLFDTIDDEDKNDEWYTPSSEINWTADKLNQKLENLSKVISSMDNGEGPDILGVQEVEHEHLLEKLIDKLPLNKNYKIVYEESPDKRGIDNALIFNSDIFSLIKSNAISVRLEGGKTTRDILHSELKLGDQSFHIFVNHWPSRREGLKETEIRRIAAAEALVNEIRNNDNIISENIVILGDFNDLPSNISISKVLGAQKLSCDSLNSDQFGLFNLSYNDFQKGEGTYRYRDHWNMLDQIIVSNSLIDGKLFDYECDSFKIIKPDFLIQKEGKYAGTSLPTYGGRKYLGGFSDHFSIGAKFIFVEN